MAFGAALVFLLIAAGAGISDARRAVSRNEALTRTNVSAAEGALQAIDKETLVKLPKLLNSAAALTISLISEFNEDEPDIEYVLENLDLQGWQLVKLTVPDTKKDSEAMKAAKQAWDHVFANLPELAEDIQDAYRSGNSAKGLEQLLRTVDLGLRAASKASTAQAKYIDAVADLASTLGKVSMKFARDMGLLKGGESLAQFGVADEEWDAAKWNSFLTTGVGLITTFISAGTEDPPDFRYAIDAFKIQGWKLVKMVVPRGEHRSPKMKKAKKAWGEVFSDASELAEEAYAAYKESNLDKTIKVVVGVLDKGLRAASHFDEDRAKQLTAVADLVQGVSSSLTNFGHEVGWLNPTTGFLS